MIIIFQHWRPDQPEDPGWENSEVKRWGERAGNEIAAFLIISWRQTRSDESLLPNPDFFALPHNPDFFRFFQRLANRQSCVAAASKSFLTRLLAGRVPPSYPPTLSSQPIPLMPPTTSLNDHGSNSRFQAITSSRFASLLENSFSVESFLDSNSPPSYCCTQTLDMFQLPHCWVLPVGGAACTYKVERINTENHREKYLKLEKETMRIWERNAENQIEKYC